RKHRGGLRAKPRRSSGAGELASIGIEDRSGECVGTFHSPQFNRSFTRPSRLPDARRLAWEVSSTHPEPNMKSRILVMTLTATLVLTAFDSQAADWIARASKACEIARDSSQGCEKSRALVSSAIAAASAVAAYVVLE